MGKKLRNVKVYSIRGHESVMNVYLDISGNKVFLMKHRYVPKLYYMLKDGIRLEDLRRSQDECKLYGWRRNRTQRRRSQVFENSFRHLILVIDEFMRYEIGEYQAFA